MKHALQRREVVQLHRRAPWRLAHVVPSLSLMSASRFHAIHLGAHCFISPSQLNAAPTWKFQSWYFGQSAKVWNEGSSWEFKILKGAKQGDPISSFLFNAVLTEVMRKVKNK